MIHNISPLLKKGETIYISTDENNKEFFQSMRESAIKPTLHMFKGISKVWYSLFIHVFVCMHICICCRLDMK